MDSGEIVTKISAEQTAKNYVADVIFFKDVAVAYNVLVAKGLAHNYVPADLEKGYSKELSGADACSPYKHTGICI